MTPTGHCFHCGERITTGRRYLVRMDDEELPVCCPGCKAVAEFIRDTGLSDYYRYRTADALRPEGPEPAAIRPEWLAFDRPAERLMHVSDDVPSRYREASGGGAVDRFLSRPTG